MTEEPKITKAGFTWSMSSYGTAVPDEKRNWMSGILAAMKYGQEGARKSHQIEHPVDPAKITAHAAFRERWEAVIREGEELGFLEDDYDGGYYVPDLYPRRETVWDETEEEYFARLTELENRGVVPPAFGGKDD